MLVRTLLFLLCVLLSLLPRPAVAQMSDTLVISLEDALEHALEASPEVDASEAKKTYAEARLSLARASRYLTDFSATSAHAVAPALDNPNATPVDRLYLDPDVRNDWSVLSPFNRIEFEAV